MVSHLIRAEDAYKDKDMLISSHTQIHILSLSHTHTHTTNIWITGIFKDLVK